MNPNLKLNFDDRVQRLWELLLKKPHDRIKGLHELLPFLGLEENVKEMGNKSFDNGLCKGDWALENAMYQLGIFCVSSCSIEEREKKRVDKREDIKGLVQVE